MVIRTLDGSETPIRGWRSDPLLWPGEWIAEKEELLVTRQTPGRIDLVAWPITRPPAAAPSRVVLAVPDMVLWGATFSPDRRWLAFHGVPDWTGRSLVGLAGADGPPDRGWHPVASHLSWVDKPHWSPDGMTLFVQGSIPGAYLNLLAIPVDPERGVVSGEPAQVTDFSSPAFRISPFVQRTSMHVVHDQVFLVMLSTTGNIWMLETIGRMKAVWGPLPWLTQSSEAQGAQPLKIPLSMPHPLW